jgi:hypothetical protein
MARVCRRAGGPEGRLLGASRRPVYGDFLEPTRFKQSALGVLLPTARLPKAIALRFIAWGASRVTAAWGLAPGRTLRFVGLNSALIWSANDKKADCCLEHGNTCCPEILVRNS